MALMEGKTQLIDLLGLAQLANQSGGNYNYNKKMMELQAQMAHNAEVDARNSPMYQEQLKQEKLKSLLAQNEYEQQTGVPTITMPGSELDNWTGPNHQVPISDIPGMVSGQRQSDYGKQVHEGLMQSGRLMAGMATAAADANAKGQMYGGSKSAAVTKEPAPNNQKGYGVYPLEALGIKDILADAAKTKADATAQLAQRGQWDQEYKNMETDRNSASNNFDKYIKNLEQQGGKEQVMAKEIASTQNQEDRASVAQGKELNKYYKELYKSPEYVTNKDYQAKLEEDLPLWVAEANKRGVPLNVSEWVKAYLAKISK
jgi:hypothetical protein